MKRHREGLPDRRAAQAFLESILYRRYDIGADSIMRAFPEVSPQLVDALLSFCRSHEHRIIRRLKRDLAARP